MGFWDSIKQQVSGAVTGAYSWVTRMVNAGITAKNHNYKTPDDTEEENTEVQEYTTEVVVGTPLRETKCLFVPEMNDFYTDEELNTIYHSADEYRNAVKKYGLIYKSQKFENADTVEKLLEYSRDWVKNNYHGGISNFNVTALDMHLLGQEVEKYSVGRRVDVMYIDPALQQEARQTLTVISCEYDLNNPDKNQYKIGIPDVTLNKVYGETSKSGGGGGGGGKSSDQTDDETNTEVDGLEDNQDESGRRADEIMWAMVHKELKEGDGSFDFNEYLTPGEKDPVSDFLYGLTADKMKASNIQSAILQVSNRLTSKYVNATGGVDTDKLSANTSNTGRTNATSIDVVGLTSTKSLKVDGKTMVNNGPVTILDVNGNRVTIDKIRFN